MEFRCGLVQSRFAFASIAKSYKTEQSSCQANLALIGVPRAGSSDPGENHGTMMSGMPNMHAVFVRGPWPLSCTR